MGIANYKFKMNFTEYHVKNYEDVSAKHIANFDGMLFFLRVNSYASIYQMKNKTFCQKKNNLTKQPEISCTN